MSDFFQTDGILAAASGKLKIYLGYAAGTGKTYRLLQEAHSALAAGTDVVIGYYEPHDRPETAALVAGLESVPLQVIEYRGSVFHEMNADAIVERDPEIVLVDELAHTNVPGSKHAKRWEDVLSLLNRGVDVWTTMNIQHQENLNDAVQEISGITVRETVPDWLVHQAAEIVVVDLTPRALLNRLDRGVIYSAEKTQKAKENFFKESTLAALREIALREAAFEIGSRSETETARREKIVVLLTPHPSTAALLRRGKRVADYLKGECIAVVICPEARLDRLPPGEQEALRKHLKFSQELHVLSHVVARHKGVAGVLAKFAHDQQATQIYLLRPVKSRFESLLTKDFVGELTHDARDLEITIVANREARNH